jgi:MFS superfamily sulfate permease-like transporter
LYTTRLGQIYGKAARIDFIASITAMLGVLIFDTLPGLILGIIVSILLLLYRSSKPHVAELGQVVGAPGQYGDVQRHPENVTVPGIAVLRAEAGLFFANSDAVRNAIKLKAEEPGTKAVILDAESIPFVDVTAAKMLQELAADLARSDVQFVIAHELGQVGDILTAEPSQSELTFYPTVDAALAAIGPTA